MPGSLAYALRARLYEATTHFDVDIEANTGAAQFARNFGEGGGGAISLAADKHPLRSPRGQAIFFLRFNFLSDIKIFIVQKLYLTNIEK